jgi:hypothetical protein
MIGYIKGLRSRIIWNKKEKEIIDFIKKNDFKTEAANGEIAVVISPWFRTYIPWFSIALGVVIKKKYNKNILFIIDDLPFSTEKNNPKFQIKSLKKVAAFLLKHSDVVFLSQQRSATMDMALIEKYAYYNAIHDLKTENFGENDPYYKLLKKQLAISGSKIGSIFENRALEYIFLPGGVCLSSGLFMEAAKEKNIRIVSYDSGPSGAFLLSTDGVAAHLSDIPKAVNMMLSAKHFDFESIHQNALSLIQDRMEGRDVFKSQIGLNSTIDFSNSVLLPLNVNWDSAALNKHKFFKDTIEWIIETTQWLLENTDKMIIIRQHPVERFENAKSCDDYRSLLLEAFGENSRVVFVAAPDEVNTYSIIQQTDLVITHTSTVASEAAVLRKNVITVSNVYYANIGFVYAPNTKQEYFAMIENILNNRPEIDENRYIKAVATYFVSQRLNWFFPVFLPSQNIEKWIYSSCDEILEMNGSAEMLEAIETDTPLPILVWRKNS